MTRSDAEIVGFELRKTSVNEPVEGTILKILQLFDSENVVLQLKRVRAEIKSMLDRSETVGLVAMVEMPLEIRIVEG